MKLQRIAFVLAAIILSLSVKTYSGAGSAARASSVPPDSAAAFLGRWDLTLKAPDRAYPSWLEVREENGQFQGQMVGRWGNARALPKMEISNGQLTFVSPKAEEETPEDMVFKATVNGKTLSGTISGPKNGPWKFTGRPAPALKETKTPKWAKPITLFDGKDLTGWKPRGPGTSSWTVVNGTLVTPGNGPELINDSKFENFKLHVEFNCGPRIPEAVV